METAEGETSSQAWPAFLVWEGSRGIHRSHLSARPSLALHQVAAVGQTQSSMEVETGEDVSQAWRRGKPAPNPTRLPLLLLIYLQSGKWHRSTVGTGGQG